MRKIPVLIGVALLCLSRTVVHAQAVDSFSNKVFHFPALLLGHLQSRTASLNQDLTRQTEKMLQKMAQREARLEKKITGMDSTGAKQLFAHTQQEYAALIQRIRTDTGNRHQRISGEYQPYVDTLQGSLSFLRQNPQLLSGRTGSLPPTIQAPLQGAGSELQAMQAKLQVAAEAKAFVQQRKMQLNQYIAQHANLQSLVSKPLGAMNQELYYYSQRVQQYKDMMNSPDRLEKKALAQLSGLPAFRTFMQSNGQLSGLFQPLGGGGGAMGTAQPIPGLQTHAQVASQVQGQVSAAGPVGMEALQSKLQSAQSQLDAYKNKLSQLGAGHTAADVPDFRPNDQKTKPFWGRLEYGANFQTTHTNYYYPVVTDLGLSLGYRLGHSKIIGLGASYKLGWGSGIQHIAITSQGVGLRSFLQVGIKGGFSATGGFEYNYTTPFTSFQQLKQLQYWTKSGLIGVTKTVSMKSRVFKKTQVQLLWDFLSYQQVPKTQALLFRIGYSF
ncbi:hypothetical protein [Puia dinghuensis]|uniref:DUF3575 domain-containing protein n=1 Tax=Puia dinghuensis TaxID=1792502 RepID=A0A8J2UB54_9BACT|nr:hypothetical protein [Puia dinghuensis]GGA91999.1 hypothetical protein GCM10011511_14250 [Puia dinghuensis]